MQILPSRGAVMAQRRARYRLSGEHSAAARDGSKRKSHAFPLVRTNSAP